MVIAPKGEANLFSNRDKFDIVAVYDESSTTFGSCETPLSILVRVISEQAFRKMLKRMPMLVVGGMEAWKRDLGGAEVVRGEGLEPTGTLKAAPSVDQLIAPLSPVPSMPNTRNPFLNGVTSSPSLGSSNETHTSFNPFRSMPVNGENRPNVSLDQTPSHSRYVFSHFERMKFCSLCMWKISR